MRRALTVLALYVGVTLPAQLIAQALPVVVEREPNDDPRQAEPFTAPAQLSGSMAQAGDQDAFVWTISDADAQRPWTLTLTGMPEALTGVSLMRIEYGPDPNATGASAPTVVVGRENLLTFGIRDGSRPVTKRNVWLPAGTYIVGLFSAGQNPSGYQPPSAQLALRQPADAAAQPNAAEQLAAYRLRIVPGASATVSSYPAHDTQAQALALRAGAAVAEVAQGRTWYRFALDAEAAQQRWELSGGVMIEQALKVRLLDAEGVELATASSDALGQFRLPNLVLEAGSYFVELADAAPISAQRSVLLRASGAVVAGDEREPNNVWLRANQITSEQILGGRVDTKGESDYFAFAIAPEQAMVPFSLQVDSADVPRLQLCLLDAGGSRIQCREEKPPVVLPQLQLTAGRYGLLIGRGTDAGSYQLQWQVQPPAPKDTELEPNDRQQDATLFGARRLIKGAVSSKDTDYFSLLTTGSAQLWRLQAIGQDLRDLSYLPQHGETRQTVRAGSGSRRLRLDNLYLLPGEHRFSLTANKETNYVLRALPLGEPPQHIEREPNDDPDTAHALPLNQRAVALLTETYDVDVFRFYLAAQQDVRLRFTPPADLAVTIALRWDGGALKQYVRRAGASLDERLTLSPGDYYLRVSTSAPSEAEYELRVDQVFDAQLRSDHEPNDGPLFANPWPASGVFSGTLGSSRAGADWYALPGLREPQPVVVTLQSQHRLQIVDEQRKALTKLVEQEDGTWQGELPAGTDGYLRVYGSGDYAFSVAPQNGTLSPPAPALLPIEMALQLPQQPVAAFAEVGQSISGALRIRNPLAQAVTLTLRGSTTDDRWRPTLAPSKIVVAADATAEVPVQVAIEADAWPGLPVTIAVAADDAAGGVAVATAAVQAERNVPLVNPQRYHPVPASLRGHVNVAGARFGAQWHSDNKSGQAALNDGFAVIGEYFSSGRLGPAGPATHQPLLQLAGSEAVPVSGFVFHPYGLQNGNVVARNARAVAVALSEDGETFQTVLVERLSGHQREQFFALASPVMARYARLMLLDSADQQLIALGEWKVLADPAALPWFKSMNLASPELGGHVVRLSPTTPTYGHDLPIISPASERHSVRARAGQPFEWVLGFHQNRRARIGAVEWHSDATEQDLVPQTVALYGSAHSAMGPWQSLGDWDVSGAAPARWQPDEPTAVRFLKFVVQGTFKPGASLRLPEQIRVLEAATAAGSILGEWGYNRSDGPLEAELATQSPSTLPAAGIQRPEHTQRSTALPLPLDTWRDGVVRLGQFDNWYAVSVPDGRNSLIFDLSASPTVRAELTLFDTDNNPVPLEMPAAAERTDPTRDRYRAAVAPGRYLLRVAEPPRSVVFVWDTSGSTLSMRPVMRQALMRYIKDVRPGLDEAQMLPFGGDFLSRRWLDQPYLLQSVLNDYNGAGNSSAAESALVKATTALRDRPGQRVIVLITDAATSRDTALWGALDATRPQIIALGVTSKGNLGSNLPRERSLMQDWSSVGGGYYEYTETVGAMARAFDRASSRIRQPARYRLRAAALFEPDPEPGALEVVSASAADAELDLPAPALEVILDASGSMLQRLDGKRRYQIARDSLVELVQQRLPDDTQFALRVFGHREAGSCRTDLAMPLATLDRAAVLQQIAEIAPKNLARTPIAESLRAVAQDLAKATGPKTVLLVTDGEETCDGDPEAAIAALQEAGLEAVINIIGFAIDDMALQATFERWARAGGGVYRSAANAEALQSSIRTLGSRRFEVFDLQGIAVARGFVDDGAVTLAPGRYRIAFAGQDPAEVVVPAGATKVLKVR